MLGSALRAEGILIDVSTGSMVAAATGGVDELFDDVDELFDDCLFFDELFDEPLSE